MIITFEGNVGAGKTSILKVLEKETFDLPHKVYYEPVEEWMNFSLGGKSLFEMFYEDRKKYGFVFQMMALQSRYQNMLKAIEEDPNTIVFCERSFFTDYEIFAKLNNEQGNITDMELHVYKTWHSYLVKVLDTHIKGIVYLNTDQETCKERIKKRNRPGEEDFSNDYLVQLHQKHADWLYNQQIAPCLTINGDTDTLIKEIHSFVKLVI